jgi:hypothetical protein
MKANEAFRKFFSLNTWRNITLYLLLFCLGTASILALAFYEPWRYLSIARSSDLILPKDPSNFPRLMIIESPHIDVAKHQEPIHPDLPPLYTNLPSDLPKEVTDYVEKRNSYIRKLSDKYTNSPKESTNTMIIEELLPYEYNGKQSFFAFIMEDKKPRLSLFDVSLNEISIILEQIFNRYNVVSAKFQDRMWGFNTYGTSALGISCNEVIYKNELTINHIDIGAKYDYFDIPPFNFMKIIHKDTNPRIKIHIPAPKGHMLISANNLIGIMPIPPLTKIYLSIRFLGSINSILLFLVAIILTLLLAYIGITLTQKHKQKRQSHDHQS